jgi:hypothetical protein
MSGFPVSTSQLDQAIRPHFNSQKNKNKNIELEESVILIQGSGKNLLSLV